MASWKYPAVAPSAPSIYPYFLFSSPRFPYFHLPLQRLHLTWQACHLSSVSESSQEYQHEHQHEHAKHTLITRLPPQPESPGTGPDPDPQSTHPRSPNIAVNDGSIPPHRPHTPTIPPPNRSRDPSLTSPITRRGKMTLSTSLFGTPIYHLEAGSFSKYYPIYHEGKLYRSPTEELRRFAGKVAAISEVRVFVISDQRDTGGFIQGQSDV